MSKKKSPSSNSDPSDGEIYQVEKIVNQRIINGKKQYKVVWTGYSFQEATWEPEANLRCPQKINQFLRRYHQVIRKKNLINKNPNDSNIQSLQKSKVSESHKVSIEKTQPVLQKSVVNQSSNLNKEKLQSSLQKSLVVSNQKKIPDIENLKSKIMGPKNNQHSQTVSDQNKSQINPQKFGIRQTYQSEESNSINRQKSQFPTQNMGTSGNFASSLVIEESNKAQAPKIIKIQSQSHHKSESLINGAQSKIEFKLQSQISHKNIEQMVSKNLSSHFSKDRKDMMNVEHRFRTNQIVQQSKISSQSSQQDVRSQENKAQNKQTHVFLKVSERLDIQEILNFISFDNQQNQSQGKEKQSFEDPKFFLIKNKFSEKEKIVERQRIILQLPLKLINFYERLLSQ